MQLKEITSKEREFKSPDDPGTKLKQLEVPSKRDRNLNQQSPEHLIPVAMIFCCSIFVSVG